tara:strand:- start:460 stop:660 length:201 start_codon:yes stop_codon:yes gene_type:complete
MAFKMKGFSGFGNDDKRVLRKSKKKLIKEQRELYRKGEITKAQFKAAKEEIKGYTDVDVAKEHLGI